MSLQEIFDVAVRYQTTMSDAMAAACIECAARTGERIRPTPVRAGPEVSDV